MASYSYSQQSEQQSQSNQGSGNQGYVHGNIAMANLQKPPMTLHESFGLIANGYMQEAMHTAHLAADAYRKHQDNQSAQWAGKIWTIANTFGEMQQIISQEKMDGVKEKAALIGTLTRALMGSGEVSQADAERVIKSAGGYWEMAEKSAKETSSNGTGAAAVAQNSETVEQYKMGTGRTYAHCGIATSLMLLQANGKGDMGDANQLVSEMYVHGSGTDVDLMAKSLRKRGLDNAQSTRSGTWGQLMTTLQKGQPVPFGVTHCTGEIVKMNTNPSKYFLHTNVQVTVTMMISLALGIGFWWLASKEHQRTQRIFYTMIHIWVVRSEPQSRSWNEWVLEMGSSSKSLNKVAA